MLKVSEMYILTIQIQFCVKINSRFDAFLFVSKNCFS